MKLKIYTDGASRGNPGPASYGFVIFDDKGNIIHKEGNAIGITTNNVAEYTAVCEALKYVSSLPRVKSRGIKDHASSIKLFADSKLVAEQLSGRFKVKAKHLMPIIEQIKIMAIELGGVSYHHIPRSENMLADSLANLALDSP